MTDPVPSKERIGFLIDYWTAKSQSHKRWPEGQGMQAELMGLIYDHTIAALKQMHSTPEPPAELALRNCLLLAMRNLHVKHPDSLAAKNWEAILRFCKEGGVEPSPLRAAQPPSDAPCPHPIESRATSSDGRPWCAECGGFVQ
jgi:hypothetical protein